MDPDQSKSCKPMPIKFYLKTHNINGNKWVQKNTRKTFLYA